MRMRSEPISLTKAVYACLLAGVVIMTAVTAAYVPGYLRTISLETAESAVRLRTTVVATELARTLSSDWTELKYLSPLMAEMEKDQARYYLDGVVGSGNRISWAGFAGTDGVVRVASGGLLDGADVTARPWFQAGLRGGFFGDVHEAVLLQKLLGGDNADPIRFIDLALPVVGASGETIGVLALHTNFDWVSNYLIEAAEARDMDFLLVNSAGAIIGGSIEAPADPSSIGAVRSATAGVSASLLETWPDGADYFSSVVPNVAYSDLPGMGWRLIGRLPADEFDASGGDLLRNILFFAFASMLIFAAAAVLFVTVFIRPLSRLTETAGKISRGEEAYPAETRSSREASRLAAALARIQSMLGENKDGS